MNVEPHRANCIMMTWNPPAAAGPARAQPKEKPMSKVTYEIVPHDGGWAYRVDGTYSERFTTHDAARQAAARAAREQREPGVTTHISWEDSAGRWHNELASGDDRPDTEVRG
jgi:hypothetical protein